MSNQKLTGLLTSIFLKISLIFYIFSLLFSSQLDNGMGFEEKSNVEIVLKFLILSIFSALLFMLEKRYFYMLIFSTTVLTPTFFILMFLSKPEVVLSDIF